MSIDTQPLPFIDDSTGSPPSMDAMIPSPPSPPAPRLCSIYLHDTFTFLTRPVIQSARQVSDHFDASFHCYHEDTWPLYRLHEFEFSTVSEWNTTGINSDNARRFRTMCLASRESCGVM